MTYKVVFHTSVVAFEGMGTYQNCDTNGLALLPCLATVLCIKNHIPPTLEANSTNISHGNGKGIKTFFLYATNINIASLHFLKEVYEI